MAHGCEGAWDGSYAEPLSGPQPTSAPTEGRTPVVLTARRQGQASRYDEAERGTQDSNLELLDLESSVLSNYTNPPLD